jgi:hypothetical protein
MYEKALKRAVLMWTAGLLMSNGWAQTKFATVDLAPHGSMTRAELNVQHPIPDPPPKYKGYTVAGPPGGIAWFGIGTVAADGNGHVFVALPIWASGAAAKNPLRGEGDKLRLLVVNGAGKGEVQRTVDFPTRSLDRVALGLAGDGAPLVFAGDTLIRIGTDGKPTAKLSVPNEQKDYEVWEVATSTTGRTVRLRLNANHVVVVDSASLKVVKQCPDDADGNDQGTFTDDLVLSSQVEADKPNLIYGLEREAFCAKRERLTQFGDINFGPTVVDDGTLLAISSDAMALRKMSGETVWTSKPPAELEFNGPEGKARLSRDGRRVAVLLMRNIKHQEPDSLNPIDQQNGTYRKVTTEPVPDSIGIWEVATGKMVGHASLAGRVEDRYLTPNPQFALSQDGALLAVVEEGSLTLWRID